MQNLMNAAYKFKTLLKNNIHALQSLKANVEQGFPYKKLKLIGVTGTNGKTTTTQMIYHILQGNGFKTGYMSTISAKIGDKELDTGFHVTTPDPWLVPKYLKMMVDAGVEYVVVESTSQGLEQNRLWGVEFEAVTITNIQSDHLDYHKTWENYAKAKFSIINKLKKGGLAVINKDAEAADWIAKRLENVSNIEKLWYSKKDISDLEKEFTGYSFKLDGVDFKLPVLGDYNLENALAAIRICQKYLPLEKISSALASFPVPVGRMDVMQKDPFVTIIDFAHTPEALEAALKSIVELKKDEAKLITVFGCAGQRDVDRRKMGAVSAEYADVTILTAEDPRDEKLADINAEIYKHAQDKNAKLFDSFKDNAEWLSADISKLKSEVDSILKADEKVFLAFNEDTVQSRKDAIECAIKIANPEDIVFITGKAHEQSLCFGETEFDWSEHAVVREKLATI